MCLLCAAREPNVPDLEFTSHTEAPSVSRAQASPGQLSEIADYLVSGYWEEAYGTSDPYGDPRRFDAAAGDTLTYSFDGLSSKEEAVAKAALQAWTAVSGLKFTEVNSGGDIRFVNSDPDGAYSYSQLGAKSGGYRNIQYSVVNVPDDWTSEPVSLNSYWFQTYIHEIGHALGLGHAGQYNGEGPIKREFDLDSWQASVMSYVAQNENPNVKDTYAYISTLMPADILAIQTLYGTDVTTRAGDTVYGSNSNVGGYLGKMFAGWFDNKNMSNSEWRGEATTFTIYDTGGTDTINLSREVKAQKIDLNDGKVSDIAGIRGGMVIALGVMVENVIGGRARDIVTGNELANNIRAMNGNDVIRSGAGADVLTGGSGNDGLYGGSSGDTAIYTGAKRVVVSLAKTAAQDTGQGRDTLRDIEHLQSGGGNDKLSGNAKDNRILSGSGSDWLGGGKGLDRLNGQTGNDALYGGDGNDSLTGGDGRDRLFGGKGHDQLDGGDGADFLAGHADNDQLFGGTGQDTLRGGQGNDSLVGGADNDVLNGEDGTDRLMGGAGNDMLTGGTGNDVFVFDEGQDQISDFSNDADTLELSAALWNNAALNEQQVLDNFATEGSGQIVLDFGNGHVLTILGISTKAELLDDMILA